MMYLLVRTTLNKYFKAVQVQARLNADNFLT